MPLPSFPLAILPAVVTIRKALTELQSAKQIHFLEIFFMSNNKKYMLSALLYLFFYLIISVIYFQPMLHNIEKSIFTPGGDQYTFIWFLAWWPKAITSGINPFITNFVWPSANLNLTWVTSTPTLAILMAPVTHIIGPIASWNILTLLATPLNAFAAFLITTIFIQTRYSRISGWIHFWIQHLCPWSTARPPQS